MYGAPMKTASFSAADMRRLDELAAERLREKGYIVLSPGDTGPLGELVRTLVERDYCDMPTEVFVHAKQDPAIRAWASAETGPCSCPSE